MLRIFCKIIKNLAFSGPVFQYGHKCKKILIICQLKLNTALPIDNYDTNFLFDKTNAIKEKITKIMIFFPNLH